MRIPSIRSLASLPLLLGLATVAGAQLPVVTGRVVSSTGAPVLGVNIDAFDTSGNEINLSNDGTDINGNFSTTVDDGPGVYTFVFYPPAPPLTTHLVGEVPNVVVVTTHDFSTITLGAGVLLSGRTVRAGNLPVANVTMTVVDGISGGLVTQVQTKTNAFGQFNLAVPLHPFELRLDATTTAFVLGSRSIEFRPLVDTLLGDVFMPPGVVVTGHVQRTSGAAVGGCDLNFIKRANGKSLYVPNDNTSAAGNFSVVVPRGNYDVEFCPKTADALAAKRVANVTFTTTTAMPTAVLGAGIKLFGTILDARGAPAADVDVDVFDAVTGADILLCKDNTNASGAYSVFVPSGTYDVVFARSGASGVVSGDRHVGVVVTAQKQLNGQLPAGPLGNDDQGAPSVTGPRLP